MGAAPLLPCAGVERGGRRWRSAVRANGVGEKATEKKNRGSSYQVGPFRQRQEKEGVRVSCYWLVERLGSGGVFFIFIFFKNIFYRNIFSISQFIVLYPYRPAGGRQGLIYK